MFRKFENFYDQKRRIRDDKKYAHHEIKTTYTHIRARKLINQHEKQAKIID